MFRRLPLSLLVVAAVGCGDPASPRMPIDVGLAKGGTTTQRVDFTITDAGLSLSSDGKGVYQDGVCGSWGSWADVLFLAPAYSKVPKSQQAACVDLAPRAATVTLAVRHMSDDPHVDDSASAPGSGTFSVQNVKFGYGAALATIINATGSTPFCGTLGLRYTSQTFPGTSDVARDSLGGGRWHMYTRPSEDIAYCENDGVAAYWHVSFDLEVQVKQ